MRILCRHGHYAFYPDYASELAEFCQHFEITLEREDDFYTFPQLIGLADYSLKTLVYKDLPATKTFEGKPWEVMRENGFVFNLSLNKLFPRQSITSILTPVQTGGFISVDVPIVQAGSLVPTGNRIVDYDAFFVEEYKQLKIMGVKYV